MTKMPNAAPAEATETTQALAQLEGHVMDEHVHRQFLQEEDFLEAYCGTVDLVVPALGHQWQPNYRCNDLSRKRRDLLLATNQLTKLTFDSAVLFRGKEGLSSIRIYLRSSGRFLVARVSWVHGEPAVEILADVAQPERKACS